MINSKLVLVSFIAFAILAMAATTIVTQEAYAESFCGIPGDKNTNYQGAFHVSPGFPSLSIPPGYPPWTPLCLPDNSLSAGFPISDH
jgi:hypothetical protein